jgi:hypothetical protein
MGEPKFWAVYAVWTWGNDFQIAFISSLKSDAESEIARLKADPSCCHVSETMEQVPMRAILERLKGEAAAALGGEIAEILKRGRE